jgi:hypothetical protein
VLRARGAEATRMDQRSALLWITALFVLEINHLKWIWWTYWDCRRCGRKNRECRACGRSWIMLL